jgi:hypothetical protein
MMNVGANLEKYGGLLPARQRGAGDQEVFRSLRGWERALRRDDSDGASLASPIAEDRFTIHPLGGATNVPPACEQLI